jgi:hypothetical protein
MKHTYRTLALFGAALLISLAGCSDEKKTDEEGASPDEAAQVEAVAETPGGILGGEDWSGFDEPYTEQCLESGTAETADVQGEICSCALTLIKANHSLSDIMAKAVEPGAMADYGAHCTIAALADEGTYPEETKTAIIDDCVAAAGGLGDKAPAYCTCFADRLEAEFSYMQMILEAITGEDYQRLTSGCLAEVEGG